MPCVVDMHWSKPPRGMIVERDDTGEIVDVRLLRSRDGGYFPIRRLACSGQAWYEALDLARKHGWRSRGTKPAEEALEAWRRAGEFEPSFQPRLRPYVKQVAGQDARAIAAALERALGDPVEMAMLRVALNGTRSRRERGSAEADDRPLSPMFLCDFVEFLRLGPFVFAWRDL
jgi:hypothetical protein